jgi:hypothetical protein
MGNRSRRELEGAAILRDMLAHPPREPVMPCCDLCGEEAVIGAYDGPRVSHFCEAHRAEAFRVFD